MDQPTGTPSPPKPPDPDPHMGPASRPDPSGVGSKAVSGNLLAEFLKLSRRLLEAPDAESAAAAAAQAAAWMAGGGTATVRLDTGATGRAVAPAELSPPVLSLPILGAQGRLLGNLELELPREQNALAEPVLDALQAMANLTAMAVERARLMEDVHSQVALWKRLVDAAWRVSVTVDRESMYRLVGEHAMALVAADGAALFLVNPEGGARCAWFRGVSREYVEAVVAFPGELPGWRVMEQGEPMAVADVAQLDQWPALRRLALSEGLAAIGLFPMILEGRPMGLVAVYHRQVRAYRPWEHEALSSFAQHAALALHGVSLVERLQRRAEELDRMYQELQEAYRQVRALQEIGREVASSLDLQHVLTTVARYGAELTGSDAAGVFQYDAATGLLSVTACHGASPRFVEAVTRAAIRPGQGAIGRAVAEQRAVQVLDTEVEPDYPFRALARLDGIRSVLAVPMAAGGELVGGLVAWRRRPGAFSPETVHLLTSLADHSATAVKNARLYRALERAYDDTLEALTAALDVRDRDTEGHSRRVAQLAQEIAAAMGLPRSEAQALYRGGLLHDIGKIGIPDAVLHKPGPLSEHEWQVMRTHPRLGHQVLERVAFLRPAIPVVLHHHERYDGGGYPEGLKGEEIPLIARVFAVADAFDAMTSDRPYRPALPVHEALQEIVRHCGTQFDPDVVAALLRVLASRPEAFPQALGPGSAGKD